MATSRQQAGITGEPGVLTNLRERATKLQESEPRFREMIDALPAAIYTTDPDGYLTHFNPAAVAFAGRVPELGKDRWCVSWKLYRPDGTVLPRDECPMAVALKEGREVRGAEAIIERPNGERVWFAPYPTLLRDATGKVTGGVNMLVDITERKRDEQASSRLAAIVESSDDAIVSKDLNGVIQTWNTAAQRLFGYTAEEAIGQPITLLFPPDRIHEEPVILQRIRRGERIEHYETVRRHKGGKLLDVSLTISPLLDGRGRIVGASKIARDITKRKQAEQALLRSNERLRRANFELQQFAYSASHDLQEPLRNVAVYSEMVSRRYAAALDADGTEFLGFITSGARRLEMLIKDLLAYTRTASAPDDENEAASAAEALESAVSNLTEAIRESGAEITSDSLPEVRVREVELRQLFQNLIGNAIKYRRPEEAPRIHVSAERADDFWRIAVRDNGIGIAPEYREMVFGMFKRLHTDGEYPGTGMGLAICQKIVERHEGRIQVESEPGRGSTFIFTLPGVEAQ